MEKKEAIEILEKQFKFLHEDSKSCESEYLLSITEAMLKIYTTLYPYQNE